MSIFLRNIARYAAKQVASNPQAKETAIKLARGVFEEAKVIAKDDNRAQAAGRAFRRAYDKLQKQR